jgi:hypothetical protein
MKREEIELVFKDDGTVEAHVTGVKGKGCVKILKDLEEILGVEVTSKPTEEYYQQEDIQVSRLKT